MDAERPTRPILAQREFWIFAAAIYIFVGIVWAAILGINTMELRDSRVRVYDHVFHDVVGAEYDGETLRLCIDGQQMHHHDEPAAESRYAVVVPIRELWEDSERLESEGFFRPRWGKHSVRVPLRQVAQSCEPGQAGFTSVPIVTLPETETIGDYFDGYGDRELDRFLAARPVAQEVLVIPQSFNAVTYHPNRQVVFVRTEPDGYGNRFIDIRVRGQSRERMITGGDVFAAMLVDALTFPYQMHVWASYASAH